MPQFDLTFFTAQIFWTLVSFLVLFLVLGRWVLPRIADILNERTQLIKEEIEDARHKREEAEELKLDYADKLAAIDGEAKKMFDESEKRLIERREQLMAEWKEEMERKKRDFHEETEVARQMAMRDIRAQSADLITAATEQLIHQKVGEAEIQKMLEESIEELEKSSPKNN